MCISIAAMPGQHVSHLLTCDASFPFRPFGRCVVGWRLNATHMPGEVMTDMPYPVYPRGLYDAIKKLSALGIPMYITETGIPDLRDDRRKDWIRGYTRQVSRSLVDQPIDFGG